MPENKYRGKAAPISVSQNFLTSSRVIRRLLRFSDLKSGDLVYEIGPGKGHITRELLKIGASVRAVELDPKLYARLSAAFSGEPGLSLRQGDFLAAPLPKTGRYKVFSNIPFSRTTDILRKLTQSPNPPTAAWLIVEEGAAKRFCSNKSKSALALRPFFDVSIACRVDRREFHPAPSVDCALLCVRRKEEPDLPLTDRTPYRQFLEQAWGKGLRGLLTKRQIATALRLSGLPQPAPDSNLLYVQWLCLFRCWRQFGEKPRSSCGTHHMGGA